MIPCCQTERLDWERFNNDKIRARHIVPLLYQFTRQTSFYRRLLGLPKAPPELREGRRVPLPKRLGLLVRLGRDWLEGRNRLEP